MSRVSWVGGAPAIAQVGSFTISNFTGTFAVVIPSVAAGKTVSVSGNTSAVQTTADLLAALQASEIPEFAEIEWDSPTTTSIRGTAKEPGKPFTAITNGTGGATMSSFTISTANSGPKDVAIVQNWYNWGSSSNALPVNADDVDISGTDDELLYNLNTFSGVTLLSLTMPANFSGKIGLLPTNSDSGTEYNEYRPTHMAFTRVTTLNIGQGEGTGSNRIKLNIGTGGCTANIMQSQTGEIDGIGAIQIKGSSASNIFNISRGDVGFAQYANETMNLAGGLRVGYVTNQDSDARVRCGSGTTLPSTIEKEGGELVLESNFGTINQRGGTITTYGTGLTMTAIDNQKGTINQNATGTLATYIGGSGSVLDFRGDPRPKTVTNCDLYSGETPPAIYDPQKTCTFTNGIDLNNVDVVLSGEVDCLLGPHRRVTLGTPS